MATPQPHPANIPNSLVQNATSRIGRHEKDTQFISKLGLDEQKRSKTAEVAKTRDGRLIGKPTKGRFYDSAVELTPHPPRGNGSKTLVDIDMVDDSSLSDLDANLTTQLPPDVEKRLMEYNAVRVKNGLPISKSTNPRPMPTTVNSAIAAPKGSVNKPVDRLIRQRGLSENSSGTANSIRHIGHVPLGGLGIASTTHESGHGPLITNMLPTTRVDSMMRLSSAEEDKLNDHNIVRTKSGREISTPFDRARVYPIRDQGKFQHNPDPGFGATLPQRPRPVGISKRPTPRRRISDAAKKVASSVAKSICTRCGNDHSGISANEYALQKYQYEKKLKAAKKENEDLQVQQESELAEFQLASAMEKARLKEQHASNLAKFVDKEARELADYKVAMQDLQAKVSELSTKLQRSEATNRSLKLQNSMVVQENRRLRCTPLYVRERRAILAGKRAGESLYRRNILGRQVAFRAQKTAKASYKFEVPDLVPSPLRVGNSSCLNPNTALDFPEAHAWFSPGKLQAQALPQPQPARLEICGACNSVVRQDGSCRCVGAGGNL